MMRAGLIMLFGLAGCFTPPTGIRAAEDALVAAENAGAAEYLPIEYASCKDLLGVAREELGKQEVRSIHRRSYAKANRLFDQAKEQALGLKERTIARKAEVARMVVPEIQMLMVSVQAIEAEGLFDTDALDEAIDDAAQARREGDNLGALIIIRDAQADADEMLAWSETQPDV